MSHPLCYTVRMIMKDNNKPTYTLWHGGDLIETAPHTRETLDRFIVEGRDMVEAAPLAGEAEVFSSHDDGRVWSLTMEELKEIDEPLFESVEEATEAFAEMDAIYEEFNN